MASAEMAPQAQSQTIDAAIEATQKKGLLEKIIEAQSMNPAEVVQIQLENDNLIAAAAMRPITHEQVLADVVAQLKAYPAFAKEAMYAKPVGKDESGKQKIARDLSIRAAEALRCSMRYNKTRTSVHPLDEDTVMVKAVFISYAFGGMQVIESEGPVSRWYKTSGGGRTRIPEDRFYGVTVKAEESRRVRECILRMIPPGLKAELRDRVEKVLSGQLTEEDVVRILESFGKFDVTLPMLIKLLGRETKHWDVRDRVDLLGMYTALREGESTVAEIFGGDSEPEGRTKPLDLKGKKGKKAAEEQKVPPTEDPPGGELELITPDQLEMIDSLLDKLQLEDMVLQSMINQFCRRKSGDVKEMYKDDAAKLIKQLMEEAK